ncbi:uncharacterized protein TNCV_4215641 [Trichonephila clavipes]|nr:uncharacterized protein TNCV_4215641 [Trichonephila clavipes]
MHHRNGVVQWCSLGGNGYLALSILKSGENQTANYTWTRRKTTHKTTVVVSTMHALYSRLIAGDSELRERTHILGADHGYTPEIMDEISTIARDLELEGNEDDIEELIMGHEDELTTEELQEILNEEYQATQRNVSPSEQEEDERGPMPTSAIKDLLKKWADVRATVLKWHLNQVDVSRVGDLYNKNNNYYFRKILKNREKQSTLDMFFNAP